MYGIEKIKNAAKAVIEFGGKLEEALEDGKIRFTEAVSIAIGTAPDAFEVAQDAAEIKQEFNDLNEEEKEQIVEYVVLELDLDADNIELIIEKGFELLVAIDNLRVVIRDSK